MPPIMFYKKLSGLLFALTCVLFQDELVVSQQPSPAVGDIYLMPGGQDATSHRVQVYLPRSMQQGQWGEICMEGSGDAHSIGTVICRQLGYTSGQLTAPTLQSKTRGRASRATDVSVWLRDVDCGPQPSVHHILRCKYNITTDGAACTPAYVNCDDTRITTNPYQGQAYLCPPLGFKRENRSTSTGLVLIYLQHSWGMINFNTKVATGSNEMDTLCRQLGFTRSNFQSGLSVYNYTHCRRSDDPSLPAASVVWLTADQFKCEESKACSGCCYKYPSVSSKVQPQQEGDLQLSCTFDPETKYQNTEGDQLLCSFTDTRDQAELKSSACAAQDESSSSEDTIIIGSVLGATTLISLSLALAGCICFVYVRRRLGQQVGEQQPLLQGGQAQPQRQRLHNLQNNDEPGN